MTAGRVKTTVAVLGLLVALGACGDDGGSSDGAADDATTDESAEDVDRYCEVAEEISVAFSEAIADSDSAEEYDEARKEIAEANADLLDEQVAIAPAEIDDEAQLRLELLRRELADDEISREESEELVEANEQIMAFEQENCEQFSG